MSLDAELLQTNVTDVALTMPSAPVLTVPTCHCISPSHVGLRRVEMEAGRQTGRQREPAQGGDARRRRAVPPHHTPRSKDGKRNW